MIYNSVPTYMADRAAQLDSANIAHRHFMFSIESPAQVDRVIDAHEKKTAPAEAVRRIK